MHLLDIAADFRSNVFAVTSQKFICNARFVCGKANRFPSVWESFCVPGKAKNFGGVKLCRGGLVIKAVATFEEKVTKSNQSNVEDCYEGRMELSIESRSLEVTVMEQQSQSDKCTELDESEELRRASISKAKKGRTSWNKGRKHTPETLQRIRERTKLAMQDPKVKMKLANFGHAQSGETRMKIGACMRLRWETRRKKLMLQKTFCYEWQNLLAEASRKGLFGEEELQWDTYKVLDEQLEQESLQDKQRKKISRQNGSNNGHARKRSPPMKKVDINGLALDNPKSQTQTQQVSLNSSSIPKYSDPLASSKLEMLKNIRAQRAATNNKNVEALTRAKLFIAEAEKAAKALEIAAVKSPVARASLIESRELIAEAIHFIESIDMENVNSVANGTEHSLTPTGPTHVDDVTNTEIEGLDEIDSRKSNRDDVLLPNGNHIHKFKFTGHPLHPLLNGKGAAFMSSSSDREVEDDQKPLPNGLTSQPKSNQSLAKPTVVSKKWVRGRLVCS